jgi:hypothetical protein
VRETLLLFNDDGNKAIESLIEENKALKIKLDVLQNVTSRQPTTPESTQNMMESTRPLQNTTPTTINLGELFWDKFEKRVEEQLKEHEKRIIGQMNRVFGVSKPLPDRPVPASTLMKTIVVKSGLIAGSKKNPKIGPDEELQDPVGRQGREIR